MSKNVHNPVLWGLVLIVIGVLFSLRSIWDIHFPVFRVLIALALIIIGIRLVMGRFGFRRGENSTIFSESRLSYNPSENSYGCIFGQLDLDLTTVDPSVQKEIEVFCTFGQVRINVSKDSRLLIKSSTTFGETKLPDNREYNFGPGTYESPDLSSGQSCLQLNTKVIFGSLKVYTI